MSTTLTTPTTNPSPLTPLPAQGGPVTSRATRRTAPRSARRARTARSLVDEEGATTAEYAITVLAACGFAAVLVVLLRSGEVRTLLMNIITSALSMGQ